MDDDKIKKRLVSCGISKQLWRSSLMDHGKSGKKFRDSVTSKRLQQTITEGKGYCFYGDSKVRVPFFKALAKETALKYPAIYFLSLRKLVFGVAHDVPDVLDSIVSKQCLFIYSFYDSSIESPYTFAERSIIEDYLIDRLQTKKSMIISSTDSLDTMKWWSSDFKAELTDYVKDYNLGGNRG